jgi:hypothetical protein
MSSEKATEVKVKSEVTKLEATVYERDEDIASDSTNDDKNETRSTSLVKKEKSEVKSEVVSRGDKDAREETKASS